MVSQKKALIAESFYIQGRELLEILNKPPGSRTVRDMSCSFRVDR